MRVKQQRGTRGSLRAIQTAVANPAVLDVVVRRAVDLPSGATIKWRSPLANDDWAEYRDRSFLDRLGLERLGTHLAEFWPTRGPQWDALATVSTGDVLLVEAKSHVNEMMSVCKAGEESLKTIRAALHGGKAYFGAQADADWTRPYYQLANRLTHLAFLRQNGVAAHLLLVCFMNDDMGGPASPEEWRAAMAEARAALGLEGRPLQGVHELFVDLRTLHAAASP